MIRKGSEVKWKWGGGEVSGKVVETYTREVTRIIKGAKVSRKGEEGNKALFIQQEGGSEVEKPESARRDFLFK